METVKLFDLTGRVAMVSGGGDGLGRAMALGLADAGARGTDPIHLNAIPCNTSKGAINTLIKDLAVQWAQYNINVNCIAPGWFPTRMSTWSFEQGGETLLSRLPLKRYGKLEELMGVVVFLTSAASEYVTGQITGVDGGLTAP